MGLGKMGNDEALTPQKVLRSETPKKPYYSVKRDQPRGGSLGATKKTVRYPVRTHTYKYPSKPSPPTAFYNRRRNTAGVPATIVPGETQRSDLTVTQLHHPEDINAVTRKKRVEPDDARRPGPRGTIVAGQPTFCQSAVKENIMMEKELKKNAGEGSRRSLDGQKVAGQTSHKIAEKVAESRGLRITGKVKEISNYGDSAAGLATKDMRIEDHVDDIPRTSRLGPLGTDARPADADAAGLASDVTQGIFLKPAEQRFEIPETRAMMTDYPSHVDYDDYAGGHIQRRKFLDRESMLTNGMIVVDDEHAGKESARSPRLRLRRSPSPIIPRSPRGNDGYAGLQGSRRNHQRDPFRMPRHKRTPRNQLEAQIAMGDIPKEMPAGCMSDRRHGLKEDRGVKRYLQTLTIDTTDRVLGGERYRPDPVYAGEQDVHGRGTKYIGCNESAWRRKNYFKPISAYWDMLTRDGHSPAGALSPRGLYNDEVNSRRKHYEQALTSKLVTKVIRHSYSANDLGDSELFDVRKRRNGPVQPQIDRDGEVIAGQPTCPTYSRGDLTRRLGESLSCMELPQRPEGCPQFSASPRYGQMSQISHIFGGRDYY